MKIEKGMRVRCISNSYPSFLGKLATITDVNDNYLYLEWDDKVQSCTSWGVLSDKSNPNFELYVPDDLS